MNSSPTPTPSPDADPGAFVARPVNPGSATPTPTAPPPGAAKVALTALVGAFSAIILVFALPGVLVPLFFGFSNFAVGGPQTIISGVTSSLISLVAVAIPVVGSWLMFRWCRVRYPWLVILLAVVIYYLASLIPVANLVAQAAFGGDIWWAYLLSFLYAAILGALAWGLLARFMPRGPPDAAASDA